MYRDVIEIDGEYKVVEPVYKPDTFILAKGGVIFTDDTVEFNYGINEVKVCCGNNSEEHF